MVTIGVINLNNNTLMNNNTIQQIEFDYSLWDEELPYEYVGEDEHDKVLADLCKLLRTPHDRELHLQVTSAYDIRCANLLPHRHQVPKGFKYSKPYNYSEEGRKRKVYLMQQINLRKAEQRRAEALAKQQLSNSIEGGNSEGNTTQEDSQDATMSNQGWITSEGRIHLPKKGIPSIKFPQVYLPKYKTYSKSYNRITIADTHSLYFREVKADIVPWDNEVLQLKFIFESVERDGLKFSNTILIRPKWSAAERAEDNSLKFFEQYLKNLIPALGGRLRKTTYQKMMFEWTKIMFDVPDFMEYDRTNLRLVTPGVSSRKYSSWKHNMERIQSYFTKYYNRKVTTILRYDFLNPKHHTVYLVPHRFFKTRTKRSDLLPDIKQAIDKSISIFQDRYNTISKVALDSGEAMEKVYPMVGPGFWGKIDKAKYEIDLPKAIQDLEMLKKKLKSMGIRQVFRPKLDYIMKSEAKVYGVIDNPKTLEEEFCNDMRRIWYAEDLNTKEDLTPQVPQWHIQRLLSQLCRHKKYKDLPMERKIHLTGLLRHENDKIFHNDVVKDLEELQIYENREKLSETLADFVFQQRFYFMPKGPVGRNSKKFGNRDRCAIYDLAIKPLLYKLAKGVIEGSCKINTFVVNILAKAKKSIQSLFGYGKFFKQYLNYKRGGLTFDQYDKLADKWQQDNAYVSNNLWIPIVEEAYLSLHDGKSQK